MTNLSSLLSIAISASIEAGKSIMEVYDSDFSIELKADKSPLTIADKLSNEKITAYLTETGLPVLSEEGKTIRYEERKNWKLFWLVDPLDGTKEFINRNGEFTVNIALIENKEAVMGVIYVPASDILYFGSKGTGSFMLKDAAEFLRSISKEENVFEKIQAVSDPLPVVSERKVYTVVASRSHLSAETEMLISELKLKHGELNFISKGSSLKICLVAEGVADNYPRLAPTMEWDTAAGQAIAVNAGCTMTVSPTGENVVYNKENLLNPYFVVSRM